MSFIKNIESTKNTLPHIETKLSKQKSVKNRKKNLLEEFEEGLQSKKLLDGINLDLSNSKVFIKKDFYKFFSLQKEMACPLVFRKISAVIMSIFETSTLFNVLNAQNYSFLQILDFCFFCFLFSSPAELLANKYKSLFIENTFSLSFMKQLQTLIFGFFNEQLGIDKNQNYTSLTKHEKPVFCSFIKENAEESSTFNPKKIGFILNGKLGSGKKTLIEAFANSFDFEIEYIDSCRFVKIRDVINQFTSAIGTNDVKINIFNTFGNKNINFPKSERTILSNQALLDLPKQNKNSVSDCKKSNYDFQTKKNTISTFFGKKLEKNEKMNNFVKNCEKSAKTANFLEKSFFDEDNILFPTDFSPNEQIEHESRQLTANKSISFDEIIDIDHLHFKKRVKISEYEQIRQKCETPNKNFDKIITDKDYLSKRKLFVFRNIASFESNNNNTISKQPDKGIDELLNFVKKSKYPFIFIQESKENDIFENDLQNFTIIDLDNVFSMDFVFRFFVILFLEKNFKNFSDYFAKSAQGQVISDKFLTFSGIYNHNIAQFTKIFDEIETLLFPDIYRILYFGKIINFNPNSMTAFISINIDFFFNQQTKELDKTTPRKHFGFDAFSFINKKFISDQIQKGFREKEEIFKRQKKNEGMVQIDFDFEYEHGGFERPSSLCIFDSISDIFEAIPIFQGNLFSHLTSLEILMVNDQIIHDFDIYHGQRLFSTIIDQFNPCLELINRKIRSF